MAGASSSLKNSEEEISPLSQQRGKGPRLGYWISSEGVWEWNECPVGGCGGLWPYKTGRGVLGRFGQSGGHGGALVGPGGWWGG
jgi:hypothetical protein